LLRWYERLTLEQFQGLFLYLSVVPDVLRQRATDYVAAMETFRVEVCGLGVLKGKIDFNWPLWVGLAGSSWYLRVYTAVVGEEGRRVVDPKLDLFVAGDDAELNGLVDACGPYAVLQQGATQAESALLRALKLLVCTPVLMADWLLLRAGPEPEVGVAEAQAFGRLRMLLHLVDIGAVGREDDGLRSFCVPCVAAPTGELEFKPLPCVTTPSVLGSSVQGLVSAGYVCKTPPSLGEGLWAGVSRLRFELLLQRLGCLGVTLREGEDLQLDVMTLRGEEELAEQLLESPVVKAMLGRVKVRTTQGWVRPRYAFLPFRVKSGPDLYTLELPDMDARTFRASSAFVALLEKLGVKKCPAASFFLWTIEAIKDMEEAELASLLHGYGIREGGSDGDSEAFGALRAKDPQVDNESCTLIRVRPGSLPGFPGPSSHEAKMRLVERLLDQIQRLSQEGEEAEQESLRQALRKQAGTLELPVGGGAWVPVSRLFLLEPWALASLPEKAQRAILIIVERVGGAIVGAGVSNHLYLPFLRLLRELSAPIEIR
jgi:hypothetical protein